MDIQQLLKGTDCSCGKHHSCDIGFVAIEKGAISHLTALTENCPAGVVSCIVTDLGIKPTSRLRTSTATSTRAQATSVRVPAVSERVVAPRRATRD